MSQQARGIFVQTVIANGAILQRRCVGFDGAQATVQGQKVLGVAEQPTPVAPFSTVGATVPATVLGTTIAETGGVFAVGDTLISDAQGRVIVTTGKLAVAAGATPVTSAAANGVTDLVGSDTPEFIVGRALQASGGAGQFVEVLLGR